MGVKDSGALDLMFNWRQTGDQMAVMLRLLHSFPGVQLWFDINLLQSLPDTTELLLGHLCLVSELDTFLMNPSLRL